jgi:hypothetical protein
MLKNIKKLYRRYKRWLGYNPPGALTSEGWFSFNQEFRTEAPIRFWFHRNFKRKFIYPFKWKYEELSYWIRYRTIEKYHQVKTGLPPGYAERDNIMLHVNFNLLKDYVEVSQAYRTYWADDIPKTWCEQHMPFYTLFFPFRRPDLGMKHLEWASTLDDPALPPHEQSKEQAKYAREILVLYKWWVEGRPNRKKVEIRRLSTGIDDVMDMFNPKIKLTPEYKLYKADLEKSFKQEEKWDNEDDKMLVRLMKIRRGLWS